MLLAVCILSYGCTWEVWRALKKLGLLSAAPRATLTHFSCSPNFLRASITRYTHTKHEQILNLLNTYRTVEYRFSCALIGQPESDKQLLCEQLNGQNRASRVLFRAIFRYSALIKLLFWSLCGIY